MKRTTGIPIQIALGLCAAVGLAAIGVSSSAQAQTIDQNTRIDPLQDFKTQDNPDPFSNRGGGGQPNSIFDLIHRSVLGPSRPLEEVNAEQRESLDAEAAAFRARQQQRLQNGQQATPAAAPAQPTATTPQK
ncbi:hypothetical protein H6F43_19895 [Leptolyngbya sp. FACHB-36]|uniref:hypothetical protein n=1 Tax=Leptolyngbya sp. FACHB-36 TaxID=2692808 RepID=UPI00168184C1|nr:hypothetical protein [Leptolyngbya sp. FACHB-36]MBD2022446.1 hypothetical protein [Leptolyngbya sp. FACHB-36]